MTCLIASRSGSNARVDSGTIVWLRLYWFCHVIGTDTSRIAARSASPKGTFPFFVVNTASGAVFQCGGVSDIVIQQSHLQDILSHSGPLGLAHPLLNVEPLPFGCISSKDRELMQLKTVSESSPRAWTSPYCWRSATLLSLSLF
jgi:hypothetical protein